MLSIQAKYYWSHKAYKNLSDLLCIIFQDNPRLFSKPMGATDRSEFYVLAAHE